MQVLNTMPQSIYIYGQILLAILGHAICRDLRNIVSEARSTFYYIRYSKHNFAKKKILSKRSTATT